MFLWAPLARRAKNERFSRVILYFLLAQFALFLPTAYALLKTEPYLMYARVHGGPPMEAFKNMEDLWLNDISVGEAADGYIFNVRILRDKVYTAAAVLEPTEEALHTDMPTPSPSLYGIRVSTWDDSLPSPLMTDPVPADYLWGITDVYFYYRDAHATLAVPVERVPAWVLAEKDFGELFNYLALNNNYYTRILLPVIFFVTLAYFAGQTVFFGMVAWLFGQTRRVTTYMTMRERFTVCVYASLPALLPGLLLGLIMPVFNILIFEVAMLYAAYKILGEY